MADAQEDYDTGDEVKVGKRKNKIGLKREREIDEMAAVLASKSGRAVMWRLMERGGIAKTSFVGDPYVTAFNEGRREQAIYLLTEVDAANPDSYALMRQEAKD